MIFVLVNNGTIIMKFITIKISKSYSNPRIPRFKNNVHTSFAPLRFSVSFFLNKFQRQFQCNFNHYVT